jgi:hypothetical protein
MKMLKISAAAALVAASLSASAMTTIADEELSQVAGQDGVSLVADLNINIGAFTYTDSGASVSFNNITVRGLMDMTIDVLGAAEFQTSVGGSIVALGGNAATVLPATATALGYNGTSDVVQFAFPASTGAEADTHAVTPTITVGSITTGNGGASFGGLQIKNLDLQGTKVWMFGHP